MKKDCTCGLICCEQVNKKDRENQFILHPLPYAENALAPYISEKTMQFHYGKHLKTYIDNTNKLKAGSAFEEMSLQEIICNASGGLFNNAAQVYNHYFYFEALQAPESENIPPHLQALIQKNFGDIIDFKEHFSQTALSLFGSGWVWLIKDEEKLEIWPTENAGTPLVEGKKPLLVLDVWEHAYYLDTQNARAKYIENFWKIVNWKIVEKRIG